MNDEMLDCCFCKKSFPDSNGFSTFYRCKLKPRGLGDARFCDKFEMTEKAKRIMEFSENKESGK